MKLGGIQSSKPDARDKLIAAPFQLHLSSSGIVMCINITLILLLYPSCVEIDTLTEARRVWFDIQVLSR